MARSRTSSTIRALKHKLTARDRPIEALKNEIRDIRLAHQAWQAAAREHYRRLAAEARRLRCSIMAADAGLSTPDDAGKAA